MNIIIDAMGGDNAPSEIVKGAVEASNTYDVKITLVGNEQAIRGVAEKNSLDLSKIEIVHTDVVITMEDTATLVVRGKENSSMGIGLNLLKDGGDAFVSAGNTGALHAGSSLIIRKINGIARSGIATIFPFERPMIMMDMGANPTVTANYLEQWAMMCSIYMNKIYHVENPEVGLLNNGTEKTKGTAVMVETYKLLSESNLNFIGNVEAREIPFGACDVMVTDGFTGNIVLKLVEGMGKFMFGELKNMYSKNMATKLSFLAMKASLKQFKKSFDASEHGGAPFLGLNKPVIKAHGSSDAKAIKNAIRQAINYVQSGITQEISAEIEKMKEMKEKKENSKQ